MFKAIVAAASLAALTHLTGQTDDHSHSHLDRATAIQHALENNKDLAAARLAISRAQARLEAAGLKPRPRLELEYESDLLFGDEGESGYGIAFAKTFPNAQRLAQQKEVSRHQIETAKLEVRQKEIELVSEVSEFALEIHLVDTRVEHLTILLQALNKTVDFASEKAASGEISPLDVSQLSLEKRVLEQEIANLEIDRERLIHRLAPLLGKVSANHFEFDARNAIPYGDGIFPGYDPTCLERSPEYQAALVQQKIADAKTELALSQNREDLSGRVFWKNEQENDAPVGKTSDHLLGVSVSVPLPSNKQAKLLSLESRQEKNQAQLAAAAVRFRIQNDIEHAKHEAEISQRRMSEYKQQVIDFAEQQLQDLYAAYQAGQLDMLSLLRAQEQRVSLENGYLELYEENAHARLELQLARYEQP